MKNNQPVTNVERELKTGVIIASRTDLKGIITYANRAFVEISGFTEAELVGRNHNIVRHPDMPPEAFANLWTTIGAGHPWTGVVKNRCKNGDFYWVKATVTPVKRDGQTIEYLSVRVRPEQEEIDAAAALYRKINAGQASLQPGWFSRLRARLHSVPIGLKVAVAYTGLVALIAGVLIATGTNHMNQALLDNERHQLQANHLAVQEALDQELGKAAALAALVAELPDAQTAFAAGDRPRLLEMFKAAHARLRKQFGVSQFQFHLPPATSFLRLHKPEHFGDDLTRERPTIIKTNADQAPVVGLDIGVAGLGLRGLTPVFLDGRHLGSVEFGMAFNEAFFNAFKAKHGVDLSLDLYRDEQLKPFATTLSSPLALDAADADQVRRGHTLITRTLHQGRPVAVLRAPLRDYAQQVVGLLQVVVDRGGVVAELDQVRNLSLAAALAALLASIVLSWFIARSITRPLNRAVEVAENISEGRYDNPIQVDREDEIGRVLRSMQVMQSHLHYDVHTVQEALRENLRVRAALDKVQSCVTVSDHRGILIYMNEASRTLFESLIAMMGVDGRLATVDELLGKPLADFFPDENLRRLYRTQLTETRDSLLEAWERTLRLITTPVYDEDGVYQGRITQWIDITEELAERKAEELRRAEERQVAAVHFRLKVALDNVSSNVMVADEQHNIIYVNESAQKLFVQAETAIRQEIANFSAGRLIGSNIDLFHRQPARQRGLLDRLKTTHQAGFEIGGRTLRFVANPVVDGEGRRLGTVVEWTDRTLEVAVEREIDGIVSAAQAGELSQRIELTGKEGFFHSLGAGINALLDEMERVFTDIAAVMGFLAHGDLTRPMIGDYSGTFAAVKGNINDSLGHLSEVVQQLREATEVIATAADEITSGNSNLSSRTEQQAASLEETASSMEQLTSTVRHNAENAQQANQLATAARTTAEQGGEVVNRAIGAMEAINHASGKIAEIISVIDEIAFQTNLLALNASVEAARAGEQGRGFAVVATEVRNLASRSAAAAKEIKELIRDSVDKVKTGSSLVSQSGVTLESMVASVKKVGGIVAEIAAASTEQAAGIDQVNRAVTSLDEVTQQNAALAEEISASSATLNDKAKEMHELMRFFKVEEGAGPQLMGARLAVTRAATSPRARAVPAARPTRRAEPATKNTVAPRAIKVAQDDDSWSEF